MKHYKTIIASSFIASSALLGFTQMANAQSASSASCSSPKVVVTFTSAVSGIVTPATDTIGSTSSTQSIPTTGLTALKFKKCNSCSETVALSVYNGEWSNSNTVYTVYPTVKNYQDANDWDVWPIQLTATVSGTTSTVTCQ